MPTRDIVFASNTGDLLPESIPVLQSLLESLQARPWIHRLRIEGHTDDRGNVEANRAPSQRRAESVRPGGTCHSRRITMGCQAS